MLRYVVFFLCLIILACGSEDLTYEQPDYPEGPDFYGICCTFPFAHKALADYRTGGRAFGAGRSGGRVHAGCDLLDNYNSPIYAVEDGTVVDHYPFYEGTDAVVVIHDSGFVVRYGEIGKLIVPVGKRVARGQLLARVGRLNSGSSMLHFEKYSGKLKGPLTVRDNWPYQRRADLQNPTRELVSWPYPKFLY